MNKTVEQGHAEIIQLCDYFAKNRAAFSAPGVKEAHVRQDLIDPFFRALGWDVGNRDSVAPQYCEVAVEDSLDVEGQQKAPDYAFRVGTLTKFYAEAKRCGVNISADPAPAFQLRRYGWSAKVALSVLTDFEEFAVYDCTFRPRTGDKSTYARLLYLRFDEYADRWRELWDVFSRQAVWSGGFDNYAASKRKRGTSEVDVEFLREIEGWRDELARNIALRNRDLSQEYLNRAVQLTIDRVVFLRMAEDRGLEQPEQLLKLAERADIYPRFMSDLCAKADAKYNSGLFHFQNEDGVSEAPDRVTPRLAVDDKTFKPILQGLYFAHGSPYAFKVLPVEILGTVYERFLGKVIRLTAGHQAKVEEKPEVRKAGGVYYTPKYIVDYIVTETVGRQIEGKSPAHLAGGKNRPPFRLLDMACGSGSFLLGGYQCLLEHCLKWYIDNGPEKFPKAVYRDPRAGAWRLTIGEKKRILTTHIFGVDIDPQAVEVSKLSLLLKVLEGENSETVGQTMQLFHERALPNLADNIKCGNSLIGPDYFAGRLIPDADEIGRVNAFDWTREFPSVFPPLPGRERAGVRVGAGGFDCIIGNPPYVRSINLKENSPLLWEAYRSSYRAASSREWDLYLIFAEKGAALLDERGKLGFILPNKFLNSQVGENLRAIISEKQYLQRIVHFGAFQIFPGVTTYTCLLFLARDGTENITVDRYAGPMNTGGVPCPLPEQTPEKWHSSEVSPAKLTSAPWDFAVTGGDLMEKFRQSVPLERVADVFKGTGTNADKVYMLEDRGRKGNLVRVYSHEKQGEYTLEPIFLKPVFRGRSMERYTNMPPSLLLIVPYERVGQESVLVAEKKMAKLAPRTLAYLRECKPRLDEREKGRFKGEGWYCYGRPQNLHRFDVLDKIVFPDVANRGAFFLDREGRWLLDTAYAITIKPGAPLNLRVLIAILNSPILTYFLKATGTALRGGYFRMKTAYLNPFPLPSVDPETSGGKATQDQVGILVDSMLALHKQAASAKSEGQRTAIARQIESTDREIDRLVYDLYGLTKAEIEIVEGATA